MSSGWWLNQPHPKNMLVKMDHFHNFRDEHSKKSLSCHHLECHIKIQFHFVPWEFSFEKNKTQCGWLVAPSAREFIEVFNPGSDPIQLLHPSGPQ